MTDVFAKPRGELKAAADASLYPFDTGHRAVVVVGRCIAGFTVVERLGQHDLGVCGQGCRVGEAPLNIRGCRHPMVLGGPRRRSRRSETGFCSGRPRCPHRHRPPCLGQGPMPEVRRLGRARTLQRSRRLQAGGLHPAGRPHGSPYRRPSAWQRPMQRRGCGAQHMPRLRFCHTRHRPHPFTLKGWLAEKALHFPNGSIIPDSPDDSPRFGTRFARSPGKQGHSCNSCQADRRTPWVTPKTTICGSGLTVG